MSNILSQDEDPGVAGAIDSSVMAFAKMGQQHHKKIDTSSRQLHLCIGRNQIFHETDRGKATHKRELRQN
jgi:hypothetical protein